MLHIQFYNYTYVKDEKDAMYYAPIWFDHNYEDDWLIDSFVKEMVLDVDKSELMEKAVWSPVLGSISFKDISGGVKTLIVLYKQSDYKKIAVNHCGDNCAKWIQEIGRRRDITILLPYLMYFDEDIEFICANDGRHIKGILAYAECAFDYIS